MAAKNKEVKVITKNDIDFKTDQNMKFIEIKDISTTKQGEKITDEGDADKVIIEKLKEIKAI